MTENDEFFPSSPRVIYNISPLTEVICQVRFPTILKIDSQIPSDFQEKIRRQFPFFEQQSIGGMQQIPQAIINMIGAAVQQAPTYSFRSENLKRYVSLNNSSLSIVFQDYSRWEEFETTVSSVLEALAVVYVPAFYTRIGLRYQNVINRETLGISEVPWSDLLHDNILGELRKDIVGAARISEVQRAMRLVWDAERDGVFLQHGLPSPAIGGMNSYIIDIDCYTERQTDANNALSVLRDFNRRARHAFRWCITERLHAALGPNDAAGVVAN